MDPAEPRRLRVSNVKEEANRNQALTGETPLTACYGATWWPMLVSETAARPATVGKRRRTAPWGDGFGRTELLILEPDQSSLVGD